VSKSAGKNRKLERAVVQKKIGNPGKFDVEKKGKEENREEREDGRKRGAEGDKHRFGVLRRKRSPCHLRFSTKRARRLSGKLRGEIH